MSIKQVIKKVVPWSIINIARLWRDEIPQLRRFNRSYARRESNAKESIQTWTMFYTHQIEKGLSHADFRYGFGKTALRNLSGMLGRLRAADPRYAENPFYINAMSALHEYLIRHEREHFDLTYLKEIFPKEIRDDFARETSTIGGSGTQTVAEKTHNADLNFEELSTRRHSVREYADRPLTVDEVMPAIELAMRTPSVCNRQPTRIHLITNPAVIAKALKIQGGVHGYKTPPMLILVTADNRAFMSPNERNEGFTDAGLFSMSLLLALEAKGIAACPLNTMFVLHQEKATRELLDIPDSENLVMYIELGHYPDVIRFPKSHRFTAEQITRIVK